MRSEKYNDLIDKLKRFGFMTHQEASSLVEQSDEAVKMGYIRYDIDTIVYGVAELAEGKIRREPYDPERGIWIIADDDEPDAFSQTIGTLRVPGSMCFLKVVSEETFCI